MHSDRNIIPPIGLSHTGLDTSSRKEYVQSPRVGYGLTILLPEALLKIWSDYFVFRKVVKNPRNIFEMRMNDCSTRA
jgi:hypothetical protein